MSQIFEMETQEPQSNTIDIRARSKWFQGTFILLCCGSQLFAQAQLGMVLVPLDEIGRSLATTDPGELAWMVASYG